MGTEKNGYIVIPASRPLCVCSDPYVNNANIFYGYYAIIIISHTQFKGMSKKFYDIPSV